MEVWRRDISKGDQIISHDPITNTTRYFEVLEGAQIDNDYIFVRNLVGKEEKVIPRNYVFGLLNEYEKEELQDLSYPEEFIEIIPLFLGNPNWAIYSNKTGFNLAYQPRSYKTFYGSFNGFMSKHSYTGR